MFFWTKGDIPMYLNWLVSISFMTKIYNNFLEILNPNLAFLFLFNYRMLTQMCEVDWIIGWSGLSSDTGGFSGLYFYILSLYTQCNDITHISNPLNTYKLQIKQCTFIRSTHMSYNFLYQLIFLMTERFCRVLFGVLYTMCSLYLS